MISCITITKNRPKLLLQSINLFKLQTYLDKQMIVIYYSTDEETKKLSEDDKYLEDNIIFYEYDVNLNLTLGEIRNYAIEKAEGDYICVWDDDDIFHPLRLETQMNTLLENKDKVACTLRRESKWLINSKIIGITPFRNEGWENSLLCLKKEMPLYAKLNCGEDTPVLHSLYNDDKVISVDFPELYVYVYHGKNTVSGNHFLQIGESRSRKKQRILIKHMVKVFSNPNNYI